MLPIGERHFTLKYQDMYVVLSDELRQLATVTFRVEQITSVSFFHIILCVYVYLYHCKYTTISANLFSYFTDISVLLGVFSTTFAENEKNIYL